VIAATVIAATVAGEDIATTEVDAREAELRASALAGVLPSVGTSEGRQLRRWLTQLLVTERVVAVEAAARGVEPGGAPGGAPGEHDVLPDAAARLELGSVTSAVLSSSALARALFAQVTEHVDVTEQEIAGYHARNPYRFAPPGGTGGWDQPPADRQPPLPEVRDAIAAELRAAARRRAFATWLDGRRAELVRLAPGYEHPGDPRQPDNTHKH
jgi:[acyl-carrier-protein] S-malonyltransferase